MGSRGEVLVAIMNNLLDLAIARDQHWYRIPVRSVENLLKARWPPQWLAFYQTKVFGDEAYAVNYYAHVRDIRQVFRWQLFPNEPHDEKGKRRYHQLLLSPLQRLPKPILSRRWRRIVFIPTTWHKLVNAVEINDLYDESPLEDRLWAELKRLQIEAERQYFVEAPPLSPPKLGGMKRGRYALDFVIFCDQGKIDVETDGDTWHADPARIPLDNQRDNDLTSLGWSILRFSGRQIREATVEYCVPTILESINRLGGLTSEGLIPRRFDPNHPEGPQQLTLFESGPDYEAD